MNFIKNLKINILFILVYCAPVLTFACSEEIGVASQFSLFFHQLSQNEKLYLFYLDENNRFYQSYSGLDDDKIYNPIRENCKDWLKYLGAVATEEDLKAFIYNIPYESISSLYFNLEKGQPLVMNDSERNNTFTKYLTKTKNLELLGYIMYARKCEIEINKITNADEWDYDTHKIIPASSTTFRQIKNGTQLYKACNSNFIKWRYAFQTVRLAHYYKQYNLADSLYTQYIKPLPIENSIAVYWCWSLKGGICKKLGDTLQASYWFAKTFINSPDKFIQAFNDYTFIKSPINKVLKLCKTAADSAAVYSIEGLTNTGYAFSHLENLYKAKPNSDLVAHLWSREIEKLNTNYFSAQFFDKENSITSNQIARKLDINTLDKLIDLGKKIVVENKAKDIALFNNGIAYLYIMKNDLKAAQNQLANADNLNNIQQDKVQTELLNWVIKISNNEKIDENNLTNFCKKMNSLEYTENSIKSAYYHFLHNYLSPLYFKQKDTTSGIYTLLYSEKIESLFNFPYSDNTQNINSAFNYTSNNNYLGYLLNHICSNEAVGDLLEFEKNNKSKTPFVTFINNKMNTHFEINFLYSLLGKRHIRMEDWATAQHYINQLPDSFIKNEAYPSPFVFNVNDQIELSKADSAGKWYNIKELCTVGADLKAKINKNKMDGESLYQYAELLYSMSYYGKNCHADEISRYNYEPGYYVEDSISFMPIFYQELFTGMALNQWQKNHYYLSNTARYFEAALNNLKDKEKRAECSFMLAKCWQKHCKKPNSEINSWDKDVDLAYVKNALTNPYFTSLKNDFNDTKTYQNVIEQCQYYQMYLKHN